MSLTDTPRANRLHIGLFGKRNSGKSSLINALTNQEVALVSDEAGTTADPVYKSMEIHGVGPVVFIDTAGFDDVGALGLLRVEKTRQAMEKSDIALIVCGDSDIESELQWAEAFRRNHTPVLMIVNKADVLDALALCGAIEKASGLRPVAVSAKRKTGMEEIRARILRLLPKDDEDQSLTGDLAGAGDLVLLVMPQDLQAPKGRLILPQVQTLRDLLDKKCLVMSASTDQLAAALAGLSRPPALIIADSQVVKTVFEQKSAASKLTTFSILFAKYKGDLDFFVESAARIESLTERSRVLIAEACTHAPLTEDIGREKIPRLLRKRIGEGLRVTVVSGADFPADLSPFDLIIHCGACMFNRKHVMSRAARARTQSVPMTNYGVALAYLSGILDKIDLR